jgi:Arc/MetJ family transcription regulator
MVSSRATTVDAYLRDLPEERRAVVSAMRDLVRRHLPKGYEESLAWGMITFGVPLERFPDTYNGQPLCYIGLAAQKNHFALYLMGAYQDGAIDRALREGFARAGKTLDMGKSCLRFKRLDELPLDVIARAVAALPPEELIAAHEKQHGGRRTGSRKAAESKTLAKTAAATKRTTKKPAARQALRATTKKPAPRKASGTTRKRR